MRNYVIIGGSSGIGESLVQLLTNEDSVVWASYLNNEKTNQGNVKYFKFDATADTLNLEDFPEKIDGIAYCPGSINLKPFHRISEENFIEDFKLQVTGATKVIRQLLPRLKASGEASIVLFSTVAVQKGFTFHSQVSISKGAIEGLTKALAAELSPGIRVNAIAPSLTDTPLAERLLNSQEKMDRQSATNPLKRVGKASDIAEMANFLLSTKSSWITGQIIHVDGGFSNLSL